MKLLLPRAMKTRAEWVPATLTFMIIVVVHRSLDLCVGSCTRRVFGFRGWKPRVRPEKWHIFVTGTGSMRREKQSECCQAFFYRPYGQGECWRELRKIIFSTHIIKSLVARLGGSTEMFEMAASRQWNWSSQADLRKRADIPVTLWNRWTGMG